MIYEVITTDQADADLRAVYGYIAFELLSSDNAAGQLDRLVENILGLEKFPEILLILR
jgi:toxin ParE1/3/4